jgi:hypothetical protein
MNYRNRPDIVAMVLRAAALERYCDADRRRAMAFAIAAEVERARALPNFEETYRQTGIYLPDYGI